jgi:hypothetical protein
MGLYEYLQTTERPAKRATQGELYRFAATYLGDSPLTVVDLPSVDLQQNRSISRMQDNDLNVTHYYGYETDRGVYDSIRNRSYTGGNSRYVYVLVRHKDILADISATKGRQAKFGGRRVDLFNLDFCSALAPTYSVFQMATGIALHMNRRAAAIVTFCPRGSSQVLPQDAVRHVFEETIPSLFNIKVLGKLRRSYSDSTAMMSWCYVLERELPSYTEVSDDNAVVTRKGKRGKHPLPITKKQVAEALRTCDGNKTHAAKQLGVSRGTLCSRVKAFGLG